MGKKTPKVPPPDSQVWKNQTEFRVLERSLKRKECRDFSEFLFDTSCCEKHELHLFHTQREAISFQQFPGLFLIRNAIPQQEQLQIIKSALEEWAKPPNVSNLDSHFHLPVNGIWNKYADWKVAGGPEPIIQKRFFNVPDGVPMEASTCPAAKPCEMKKPIISVYDPESDLIIDSPVDNMLNNEGQPVSKVLNRIRWLTLAHQYNWSKKEYHFDRVPPFPSSLAAQSLHIVKQTECLTGYDPHNWRPEAGIVNFYQPGDSLTAHQDRSEINTEAPLLSISLGLECIFLLGTEDRAEKPIALHLKSGDLVIMSKGSRRSFHGVPRVIEETCPDYLDDGGILGDYIKHTRINVNIRQVF